MKNTTGNLLQLTVFGESHGACIGAVLDGLPAGFSVNMETMEKHLNQRRGGGPLSTKRAEADIPRLVSGYFEGKTTGTPLTIIIDNMDTRSQDYAALKNRLRPGHADWSAFEKYHGFQDYRGGGHFSGRITAPLVAAGSICRQILESFGILVSSHIVQLENIEDEKFSSDPAVLQSQMEQINDASFPVIGLRAAEKMESAIMNASNDLDSVGGVLETVVTGLPAGVGEPFFDSLESRIAHMMFSVPAVKGVSFGLGFGFASLRGSKANDPLGAENGKVISLTNNNGGINGGISNGMPIVFNTCIKPTPSIYQKQNSVSWAEKEPVELEIKGRHDPAIIHRARAVVDALTSFVLLDALMEREGTEFFQKEFAHAGGH